MPDSSWLTRRHGPRHTTCRGPPLPVADGWCSSMSSLIWTYDNKVIMSPCLLSMEATLLWEGIPLKSCGSIWVWKHMMIIPEAKWRVRKACSVQEFTRSYTALCASGIAAEHWWCPQAKRIISKSMPPKVMKIESWLILILVYIYIYMLIGIMMQDHPQIV